MTTVLLLALLPAAGNVPEGFAVASTLRANGVRRRRRLWLSASFFLPVLAAAAVAFVLLRGRPASWQYTILVGAAGLYTVAVFEDIITEAHEASQDRRASTIALVAGFALFGFVSTGLGT